MLVVYYKSKKELKESIGTSLSYTESSVFGKEFKCDGKLIVSNRPHLTGLGREFFAEVTMKNNKINLPGVCGGGGGEAPPCQTATIYSLLRSKFNTR